MYTNVSLKTEYIFNSSTYSMQIIWWPMFNISSFAKNIVETKFLFNIWGVCILFASWAKIVAQELP